MDGKFLEPKFQGTKVRKNFRSREQKGQAISLRGAKVPGSEMARERMGQGAKGTRGERARKRIGQVPIGRFAPGSELARERKGSVPRELVYLHPHVACPGLQEYSSPL